MLRKFRVFAFSIFLNEEGASARRVFVYGIILIIIVFLFLRFSGRCSDIAVEQSSSISNQFKEMLESIVEEISNLMSSDRVNK